MTVGVPAAALGLILRSTLAIVLARSLRTAEYGLVGVLLGVVALLAPLWGHLSHQVARAQTQATAWRIVRHALPVGLTVGVIIAVLSPAFPASQFRGPLFATALLVATEPVTRALTGMAARTGGAAHAVAQASRSLVILPLVAVMAWLTTLTPQRVMLAFGVGGMIYATALCRAASHRGVTRPKTGLPRLRDTLSAGMPLAWASLAMMATSRLDLVMLGFIDGTELAGGYQTALVVTDVPLALYAAALSRYVPSLRTLPSGPLLRAHYSTSTLSASLLVLPSVVGIAVWGDVLTEQVFGPGYRLDEAVYLLLAAGMAVHLLAGPNGVTMIALGRDRAMARLATIQLTANVGLNALLIPRFGAVGAASATVAAYLIFNAALARSLRMDMGGKWHSGSWLRPCLALLAVSLAVAVAVRAIAGPTLLGLVMAAFCLGVVWITALTRSRVLYGLGAPRNKEGK